MTGQRPWTEPMPEAQFDLMRQILAAPSPIGLEAAMTFGVLEPYFESFKPKNWRIQPRHLATAAQPTETLK